ncbi:hypothetical protein JCM3775_003292 [Rhodotorula graminis]
MDLSDSGRAQLAARGGADGGGNGQLSGWGGEEEATGGAGWTGQHGYQPPLEFVDSTCGDYPSSSSFVPAGRAARSSWMGAAPPASMRWPASTSTGLADPFSTSQPHPSDLGFPSSAYGPPAPVPRQQHYQLADYTPHDAVYPPPYTAQQAGLPFANLPSHPPSASYDQYLHPPPPPEPVYDLSYASELRRAAPKRRREQSHTVAADAPPFALAAPSFYVGQSDGTGAVSTPTAYLHAVTPHGGGGVEFPQVETFEPALPPNLEANYAVYASDDGAAPQQSMWYLPDPHQYQPVPAAGHLSHVPCEHSALPPQFRPYDPSLASVRRHSYVPNGTTSMSVPERPSSVAAAPSRPAAASPRAGLDPFSLAQLGTPTSIAPLPPRPTTFTLPAPSTSSAPSATAASRSGTSTPARPVHVPPAPPAPASPPPERTPSPLLAPEADEDLAQVVALASIRRALHETLPPPLACKPARGAGAHAARPSAPPSASTSRRTRPSAFSRASDRDDEAVERDLLRSSGKVNRNQQKEVSSIEVLARCATCTVVDPSGAVEPRTLARLVLRALPPQLVNAIEQGSPPTSVVRVVREPARLDLGASCWACLGARQGEAGVVRAGAQSYADEGTVARQSKVAVRQRQKGYDATLSAAIDKLEQLGLDGAEAGSPSASPGSAAGLGTSPRPQEQDEAAARAEHNSLLLYEPAKAPTEFKNSWLRCDVCDFICGVGSAVPVVPAPPQPHGFTVEVICARCSALFRCCSDCGGGGGRLTPGRWRCKELFPDGRKTCQLSHARNPALGEVTIEVLAVADVPPAQLEVLESRCRAIYFNSRLAVVARPEFLLRGDGLARSFREAEAVTVDHWGQLATILREPPPEGKNIKRYITGMYSTPRKRHPKRGKGKEREPGPDSSVRPPNRVAFGFSITEFDLGTVFFCCVMPWPVNGQAFDATTILGEAITQRVKADRVVLNQQRALANPPLPPFPPATYNYIASPFRVGSRANASLARRGFETVEELTARDPHVRPEWFKVGWLPDKYAAALTIFIRRLESEEDLGGPPTENAPRKRTRKSLASTTTSSESPSTSSRSAEPPSRAEGSPFAAPGGYGYPLGPPYAGVQAHYAAGPPSSLSTFGAP